MIDKGSRRGARGRDTQGMVWEGPQHRSFCPMEMGVHHRPGVYVSIPLKYLQSPYFWILRRLPHRTGIPSPPSLWRSRGGAGNSKLLLVASPFRLSGDAPIQDPSRSPPRGTSSEQKMLRRLITSETTRVLGVLRQNQHAHFPSLSPASRKTSPGRLSPVSPFSRLEYWTEVRSPSEELCPPPLSGQLPVGAPGLLLPTHLPPAAALGLSWTASPPSPRGSDEGQGALRKGQGPTRLPSPSQLLSPFPLSLSPTLPLSWDGVLSG